MYKVTCFIFQNSVTKVINFITEMLFEKEYWRVSGLLFNGQTLVGKSDHKNKLPYYFIVGLIR
jgi:hypothetical protein